MTLPCRCCQFDSIPRLHHAVPQPTPSLHTTTNSICLTVRFPAFSRDLLLLVCVVCLGPNSYNLFSLWITPYNLYFKLCIFHPVLILCLLLHPIITASRLFCFFFLGLKKVSPRHQRLIFPANFSRHSTASPTSQP